jgi:LmbE family N-acetylglucosaminyl deacetylase
MSRHSAVIFEPHNDDFIIGMGATGIQLLNLGWDIVSVVMTDGRYGGLIDDPEQTAKTRGAEKEQESNQLGTEWINIGYEDQSLAAISSDHGKRKELLSDLLDILHQVDPSIAFVTAPLDGHSDHRATYDLVTSAIEQSQCETGLIEYTVWDVPFFSPEIIDTNQILLVEVDDTFEEKISTIQIHESQLEEYPYDDMVRNFNRYLENIYHPRCQAEFVELFHVSNDKPVAADFIDAVGAIDVTSEFHTGDSTHKG